MRIVLAAAFAAMTVVPSAMAQEVTPAVATRPAGIVAVARPEVTVAGAMLPPNSEIVLRLDQELTSKRAREGDTFNLSVAQDVMIGNFIVIPRGTPARGIVAYRTGKGAFGKSAKMEIDLTSVEMKGVSVPVTGHYRQEGEGNTGATVGAAVAAGPFAAFVTGRSAVFPQGREMKAFTRAALPVAMPD
ncbi:hypothetical protein ACVWZA_002520 [Sphingomonas sp. UYAg733]